MLFPMPKSKISNFFISSYKNNPIGFIFLKTSAGRALPKRQVSAFYSWSNPLKWFFEKVRFPYLPYGKDFRKKLLFQPKLFFKIFHYFSTTWSKVPFRIKIWAGT
jgi:hypothetical protein